MKPPTPQMPRQLAKRPRSRSRGRPPLPAGSRLVSLEVFVRPASVELLKKLGGRRARGCSAAARAVLHVLALDAAFRAQVRARLSA